MTGGRGQCELRFQSDFMHIFYDDYINCFVLDLFHILPYYTSITNSTPYGFYGNAAPGTNLLQSVHTNYITQTIIGGKLCKKPA